MEVQDGYKNMGKVLAVEMVGTGLLLLSINFGANSYSAFIIYQAETVACILFCLILCLGSISGGHFNPAVTVAVLIKEGRKNLAINLLCTALIILAQIIGATIGCLLALPGLNFGLEHTDLGMQQPQFGLELQFFVLLQIEILQMLCSIKLIVIHSAEEYKLSMVRCSELLYSLLLF